MQMCGVLNVAFGTRANSSFQAEKVSVAQHGSGHRLRTRNRADALLR
jgi:hypothetical protein